MALKNEDSYNLYYNEKKIDKVVSKIPANTCQNILKAINKLEKNPFTDELDIIKLKGTINGYRIRIGDYRIIYNLDQKEKTIEIENIKHRGKGYK